MPSAHTWIYGKEEEPPRRRELRAGPLSLQLEGVEVASVFLGEKEVLRRIYAAVRDRNWGTIPAVLSFVEEDLGPESFRIRFTADHRQREIDFTWQGTITGSPDGTVTYRHGWQGADHLHEEPDRVLRAPPRLLRRRPLSLAPRRRHDRGVGLPAGHLAPPAVPGPPGPLPGGVARAAGPSSGWRGTPSRPRTSGTGRTPPTRPTARRSASPFRWRSQRAPPLCRPSPCALPGSKGPPCGAEEGLPRATSCTRRPAPAPLPGARALGGAATARPLDSREVDAAPCARPRSPAGGSWPLPARLRRTRSQGRPRGACPPCRSRARAHPLRWSRETNSRAGRRPPERALPRSRAGSCSTTRSRPPRGWVSPSPGEMLGPARGGVPFGAGPEGLLHRAQPRASPSLRRPGGVLGEPPNPRIRQRLPHRDAADAGS